MACSTHIVLLSLVLYICNGLQISYALKVIQMDKAQLEQMEIANGTLEGKQGRSFLYSLASVNNIPIVARKCDSQNGKVRQTRINVRTKPHWVSRQSAEDGHKADGSSSTRPEGKEQGSSGLLYGYCPGMCQCNLGRASVTCKSGYWRHIPKLPGNCTLLSIETGHITTLETHSFSLYPNLTLLYLKQVNMNKIQSGAFEGLPSLQMLSLNRNRLRSLPTSAFQNNPVLTSLFLNDNDFQELPHNSICVIKHLTYLYVAGNKLTSLSFPPCYMNLSHLSTLDLSRNPIDEIHKQDFANLECSHMRDLRLNNCKLKRLQEDVFAHLQGLTSINLSVNKFQSFPKDIFKNLTSLLHLYVSHNCLHTFIPDWTVNSLKMFNIGYNHITCFNLSNIHSLSNVRGLILDSNRLVNLSSRIFTNMGLYGVENLSLKRCSLRHIASYAFQNLTRLKTLSLTENPLTAAVLQQAFIGLPITFLQKLVLDTLNLKDINNNTFVHLAGSNVTELVLDHSGIEKIPSALFSSFLELGTLSLKRNTIVAVDDNCFLSLTKLNKLWLNNNNLVYCTNPLHTGLTSALTDLDLSGNLIQRIDPECIDGLDQLRKVYLENNKLGNSGLLKKSFTGRDIQTLDFSKNRLTGLANDTLNNMTSLLALSLHDNEIAKIETGCFQGLASLKTLNLANNPVLGKHIDDFQIALSHVPELRNLKLASCGIARLPVALLHTLTKLQNLYLTNNAIIFWEPEFFLSQKSLTSLHLRRNKIVTINSTSVQYLSALREIYLDFNPFSCSCNIREFRNWIFSGRFYVDINVYDNKSYACASPPDVKGISLLEVNLGFRVCGPIEEIIGGSVGGFALVLVIVSSVIMYRYRWYIRYGCFLVRGRLRQRRNQERLVECTYDAFVSYNHGDQRWVIEHLLPELEYRGNIRLCLHDRDWLAGPDVADNIIDSIENSHKTILILSNHFAQSQWCELEMSMAQHKLLTSQKDVLVLVLKDPIDDCYMTSRLRHLMTTQTYLAWEAGDPQKVRRFWKALRQAVKGREAV